MSAWLLTAGSCVAVVVNVTTPLVSSLPVPKLVGPARKTTVPVGVHVAGGDPSYDGDTYRAVYTVRLAGRIYVLHVFQQKSKAGIKTPKTGIDLIRSRLTRAEEEHARWLLAQKE